LKIRLADEDRERLGLAELIEYTPGELQVDDAEAIDLAGGDWTAWGSSKAAGLRAAVWLELRKTTPDVKYADVKFNAAAVFIVREPGKAPSAKSAASTRGKSAASSQE
jgi:hypothetical protein